MRQTHINFMNKIIEQVDFHQYQTLNIENVIAIVENFKKENNIQFYGNMEFKVENGFLFIDGKPTERITERHKRTTTYSEKANYYEILCLRD